MDLSRIVRSWRRVTAGIAMGGLLCAGGVAARLGRPEIGPRLQIDRPNRDLGILRPTTAVKVAYEISNTGDRDLCLRGVHASCGCAGAELSNDVIAPGHHATLSIRYETPLGAQRRSY